MLSSVDQALAQQARTPGPVHFNCMYPEPLYPGDAYLDFSAYLAPSATGSARPSPWSPWQLAQAPCPHQPDWDELQGKRGLIVAGRIQDPAQAKAVAALAERLGWPLLADLQSQLRFDGRNLVHADLALQHSGFWPSWPGPRCCCNSGARLISKRLGQFIKQQPWQAYWLIDPQPARLDPDYRLRRRLLCEPGAFAAAHPVAHPPALAPAGGRQQVVSQQVRSACERFSELGVPSPEPADQRPAVCRQQHAGPADGHARRGGQGPSRVMTNRGASGIDGLIATAYGFAQSVQSGSNEPTTLLLGDLSALHDLNSLALLGKSSRPLVVILLNNDGGSIFRMLPVPTQDALLETYCLPHGLHFEHAAAMFGLHYRAPTTLADFERDYTAALEKGLR